MHTGEDGASTLSTLMSSWCMVQSAKESLLNKRLSVREVSAAMAPWNSLTFSLAELWSSSPLLLLLVFSYLVLPVHLFWNSFKLLLNDSDTAISLHRSLFLLSYREWLGAYELSCPQTKFLAFSKWPLVVDGSICVAVRSVTFQPILIQQFQCWEQQATAAKH